MNPPAPDADLEELFHLAVARPEAERESWVLAQDSWPAATRSTVVAMLRAEGSLGTLGRRLSGDAAPRERIGPYAILAPLGAGGGGTVFLGRRTEPPERLAAVKLTREAGPEFLRRFAREQAALARLDHPGIASILECGDLPDGRAWLAMEFVPGPTLTEHAERLSIPTAERVRLVAETCDAVAHAHDRAVLHRDLKPSNVLVDTRGERPRPVVIDLGLAKALDGGEGDGAPTETGHFVGTVEYLAPEQALGAPPDVRMDVFSLGCLLAATLTGRPPRRVEELRASGRTLPAAIATVPTDPPSRSQRARDDTATRPEAWAALDAIVAKAAAAEPADRYPSVRALRADLLAWLEGRGAPGTAGRRRRPRPARWWPLVAAAIAGAALAAAAFRFGGVPAPRGNAGAFGTSESDTLVELSEAILVAMDPWLVAGHQMPLLAHATAEAARTRERQGHRLGARERLLLAQALFAAGDMKEAIVEGERALQLDAGADPRVEIRALLTIAGARRFLREDEPQARDLADRAGRLIELHLDPDDRETMEFELNRWRVLAARDPIAAAEAQERTWAIARRVLGDDDPLTVRLEHARALALAMTGSEELALEPNRAVLTRSIRLYGERHPVTLATRQSLMMVFGFAGRYREAVDLYRSFARDLHETLGADANIALLSANNAGSCLIALGLHAEALPLLRDTHDRYCRKFDRGHPLAMVAERNLIDALIGVGDDEEAFERLRYHLDGADDRRERGRKDGLRSRYRDFLVGRGFPLPAP